MVPPIPDHQLRVAQPPVYFFKLPHLLLGGVLHVQQFISNSTSFLFPKWSTELALPLVLMHMTG